MEQQVGCTASFSCTPASPSTANATRPGNKGTAPFKFIEVYREPGHAVEFQDRYRIFILVRKWIATLEVGLDF